MKVILYHIKFILLSKGYSIALCLSMIIAAGLNVIQFLAIKGNISEAKEIYQTSLFILQKWSMTPFVLLTPFPLIAYYIVSEPSYSEKERGEMNRLTLKNINKQFKDNTIFENINLELESSKIYGLIGPNGSKKSVLFQIMCGLSLPTHGEVITTCNYGHFTLNWRYY